MDPAATSSTACKNRHRAAPVPVADTRTLDGDHAQATEDVSKNAELDIDVMSKNDGQAELRKDGDDAQATEDDDDYLAKKEGDDAGYFSCETQDTEHDDEGYFSCETQDDKERAFGIQSDDARSKERALDIEVAKLKNGQDTHLASAADLSKGKNEERALDCEVGIGPFTPAAGKNEPAPPARPVGRPRRARGARRRPARAVPGLDDIQDEEPFLDPEVDECKAVHLRYRAACSSLGDKSSIYCLACFIKNEEDPVKLRNDRDKVLKHMKRFHKSGADPFSVSVSELACFADSCSFQPLASELTSLGTVA
ncbi:hypothetical protein ZWY2020_058988 [Hordeum vulgare]|nr:hypothetical protein ZWY2020_058988 [Hordeum vulgare]